MIDVNVTATSFVVVSSSTQQNYTVSSDNTIFTITNVTPNYTVTASGINITFQTTGGNGYFDEVVANTGTFQNLFTEYFTLNGLEYPHSRGLYGQVLATNGSDYANWVNLGDLNFWSLNSDLLTNSFNIVTGVNPGDPNPQLTVGSGITSNLKSYIKFNEVLPATTTGTITILGNTTFLNPVTFSNGISIASGAFTATTLAVSGTSTFVGTATFGDVRIRSVNTLSGWTGSALTYVNIEPGIRFADGTILTSTNALISGVSAIYAGPGIRTGTTATNTTTVVVSLNTATTATIGGVVIGTTLYINTQTAVVNVNTATTATAGVMKIGAGLVLNTLTNAVDVSFTATTFVEAGRGLTTATNTTTGALIFNVNTATTATFGGVVIGPTLYINTQTAVVNVNTATTATAGIVRIGDGISVNATGTITLTTASTTQLGGIRVGANLNMDNEGYLSAVGSGLSAGSFNLTATSYTNSVPIYNGVGNTSTGLIIGDNRVDLFSTSTGSLTLTPNDVRMFAGTQTFYINNIGGFGVGNETTYLQGDNGTERVIKLVASTNTINAGTVNGLVVYGRSGRLAYWQYEKGSFGVTDTTFDGEPNNLYVKRENQWMVFGPNRGIRLYNEGGTNLLLSATTASIQYSSAGPALTLLATTATLSVSTASSIQITTSSIAITAIANSATSILLRSSQSIIGNGQYASQLRVQEIYNYAGTFAPVVPAGIQFGDNSVQTTAWQPDELSQRFVDFQNPTDPTP
jgi:hypothetical protein